MSINQTTAGAGGGEDYSCALAYLNQIAEGGHRTLQMFPNEARAILARLPKDAALASAPPAGQGNGEPAGWKLVPVEPTEEMIGRLTHIITASAWGRENVIKQYGWLLASAPPAPTPDAGSDLAKLSEAVWGLLREWDTAPELPESLERRLASFEDAWSLFEEAHRSSSSPPPAEDLAGRGEPVACSVPQSVHRFVQHCEENVYPLISDCWALNRRQADAFIDALNAARQDLAAPAPSRPADRAEANRLFEAIKDALYAADVLYGHPAHARLRELRALALRDATRTGGDGWRPMDDCPSDGEPVWVFGGFYGKPTLKPADGDWWRYAATQGFQNIPTSWQPQRVPPSPNAGDGTQPSGEKGGGR